MFFVWKVLDLFFARKMLFRAAEVKGFYFLVLCQLLIFLCFISLNIHGLWITMWVILIFGIYEAFTMHVPNLKSFMFFFKQVLGVRWSIFTLWRLIKIFMVLGKEFLRCTSKGRPSLLLFCHYQRQLITIFFWYNKEQNTYANCARKSSPSCYMLDPPALSSWCT